MQNIKDVENEIEDRILGMLGQLSVPKRDALEIAISDSLEHNLNIDSLSFVELLIEIENTFNIQFDEDFLLMDAYPNVGSVIDQVKAKISGT
jgi:acyl carrier protein